MVLGWGKSPSVASKMTSLSVTFTAFGPELDGERLIRLVAQAVEKCRIDGRGLFSDQPRERGALGAVSFAGGAEAAEQMNLEPSCFRQLGRRQLRAALVEVIGDAHRADRMRTRRARSHLVELVQQSSSPVPFAPSRHSAMGKAAVSADIPPSTDCLILSGNGPASEHGGRADQSASHQEGSPIDAAQEPPARLSRRQTQADRPGRFDLVEFAV